MLGKIGMVTVGRVALATQFVSATDGIDSSIFSRSSHFKDCVVMAMCLIVALFPPFFRSMLVALLCNILLV